MSRRERGVALLEVLVALAILSTTGLALVGATIQAMTAEREAERAEVAAMAADRLLTAMTLLGRADLVRRIGRHRVGEFVVEVQRPRPGLYRIAIGDSIPPYSERLVTVVFRPDSIP